MKKMKGLIESIQQAQSGDWDALCAIVEKLRNRIQSMADFYAMHCSEDAEDLTQEAWLGALEALRKVDTSIGDPQQFIIKHAKWRMLNFVKWNKRRQHEPLEELEEIDSSSYPAIQEPSLASMHLSQFVNQLNGKQRVLVNLLLAGNTWREAASKLGCTSANVAYHVRQIQKVYLRWIGSGGASL
jgi:RNA polymerase sigma factor (sigma-70 family)